MYVFMIFKHMFSLNKKTGPRELNTCYIIMGLDMCGKTSFLEMKMHLLSLYLKLKRSILTRMGR